MSPRSFAPFAFLSFGFVFLTACGGSGFAPALSASGILQGAPSSPDIYIDVESKGQLGGIPYYVDGHYKVSVATFAEDPGPPKTFDKRVAFTGVKIPNQPYTYGWIGIDRQFSGDTEFRATVAVKSNPGVLSGYGGGYILMNYPAIKKGEDSTAHTYLGAAFSEFTNGFFMQAWDANVPVGLPLSIPDASQVDLRMTRVGGNIVMSARKTPFWPSTEGGWLDVFTVPDPMLGETCSLEFGAEAVDPGGQVFLDYFYVGGPTVGGVAETSPITHMNQAIDLGDQARAMVELPTPDFVGASGMLVNALTEVAAAKLEIDTGIENDTFQEGTRDLLARKAAERARKAFDKARIACDTGLTTKTKSILKSLTGGRGHCVVTIANLAGVKTTTDKKLPLSD